MPRPRLPQPTGMPGRLAQVVLGLVVIGTSIALQKQSVLGLAPWDVLHDGIGAQIGVDLGLVGLGLGVPILLLWLPLGERPHVGTVLNVLVIGSVTSFLVNHTEPAAAPWLRAVLLVVGITGFALGQGLYLSPRLGAGPRDGLMTGLHRRFGWSIRVARFGIEAAVLVAGTILGGTAGLGTVLFAIAIGPLVQVTLGWFGFDRQTAHEAAVELEGR